MKRSYKVLIAITAFAAGVHSDFTLLPSAVLASELPVATASHSELPDAADQAAKLTYFEQHVRPLLVQNCYICHSEHHKQAGGLRVDNYQSLLGGGNNGPAVVAGDEEASVLLQRVTQEDPAGRMPPDQPLSEDQIAILKRWVADGAVWPAIQISAELAASLSADAVLFPELKESHWAWQPIGDTDVPRLPETEPLATWGKHDVDQFLANQWHEAGVSPAGDADAASLARRLYYDLTGLPPTWQQIRDFETAPAETRVETLVDQLLASQAFGEQWGRHWLDIARYGESTGSARNLPYPHAWRYREYVIQAFNQDRPYDQFIREQIAGDLLPAENEQQRLDQLVATGFLSLGVKDVNQRFKVRYDMDVVDEQIDAVTRGVLGLTASCARCHDHKTDPIPTRDYYALAGVFTSTATLDALRNQMGGGGLDYYVPEKLVVLGDRDKELTTDAQQAIDAQQSVFEDARKAFVAVRDLRDTEGDTPGFSERLTKARQKMRQEQNKLTELRDPAQFQYLAHGVRDTQSPTDTQIRLRGIAEDLGPEVPRGVLSVLEHVPVELIPDSDSGRLQLAQWATHPENALTARVAVNRIWQKLFGAGLVRTVDNFGVTGDTPSHPELLDYLSQRFVAEGWSTKNLVRYLVTSRAYQLSADRVETSYGIDPDNRLVWRRSPRRLTGEELRDTLLLVSNQLTVQAVSQSPSAELPVREVTNNGGEAKRLLAYALQARARSIYLPALRGITPHVFEVFDAVDQSLVTGSRQVTTVPTQSLFFLNDTFVAQIAGEVLDEVVPAGDDQVDAETAATAIQEIYRRVLFREPSDEELYACQSFLEDYATTAAEDRSGWIALCQSLFGTAEFRYIR